MFLKDTNQLYLSNIKMDFPVIYNKIDQVSNTEKCKDKYSKVFDIFHFIMLETFLKFIFPNYSNLKKKRIDKLYYVIDLKYSCLDSLKTEVFN